MSGHLLITDLDGTLMGDEEALERFNRFFAGLAGELALVYATGRSFGSVQEDVQHNGLLPPVAVISDVGSEVRLFADDKRVPGWAERVSENWSATRVRELLAEEPDLERQPEAAQSAYKISYWLPNAAEERLAALRDRLAAAGIDADTIYSSQRDLDFVPTGVNKGTAAAFLAKEIGFESERMMVAGNSINDLALFQLECRGIVTSNAHDELKRLVKHRAQVYLSPHPLADGVRDGVEHWLGRKARLTHPS